MHSNSIAGVENTRNVCPPQVPNTSRSLDCERSSSRVLLPAPEVSLPPDPVHLSARSLEEDLNLNTSLAPGPETSKVFKISGPVIANTLQVPDFVSGTPGSSSPTSPSTTFTDPEVFPAPDLPDSPDFSPPLLSQLEDRPVITLDPTLSSKAICIALGVLPAVRELVSPWISEQAQQLSQSTITHNSEFPIPQEVPIANARSCLLIHRFPKHPYLKILLSHPRDCRGSPGPQRVAHPRPRTFRQILEFTRSGPSEHSRPVATGSRSFGRTEGRFPHPRYTWRHVHPSL